MISESSSICQNTIITSDTTPAINSISLETIQKKDNEIHYDKADNTAIVSNSASSNLELNPNSTLKPPTMLNLPHLQEVRRLPKHL